ncbi:MAG: isoprenylcysteine carboxylmethyltransferase family protein [Rhodoplanes sp.]|uniref:methyltransferase family protein n=1 Tax=Rhodoplanes sp. TaxID=1968906 RepID=UPI00180C177A|nr:isoprenylcysteine carboxylmethyltransferase family protein [Rhodoplanes sp.]NVO15505.1 isoprenylcysteine carboxylmethyltransferase family protein [Rhodoplanes sp.]
MTDLARRTVLGFLRLTAYMTLLVIGPAGSLHYWPGWLFLAATLAATAAISVWLLAHDRALLERRLTVGPAAEPDPAQRRIQIVAGLCGIALMVVPGLDYRFHWSDMPMPGELVIVGNLGVLAGYALCFLVFRENSYAAGTVAVEDSQPVVSTGPYAVVRHPMYASAGALAVFGPLALGSWWGFVPAAALIAAIAARLLAEERYLATHLPGYPAYQAEVRWRLVPGVW